MLSGSFGKLAFKMSDLETSDSRPLPGLLPSNKHAPLINEYGWLWLNRDGSPTRITEPVYPQLMCPNATPRERLDMCAYLLAGKTEFWRAHRQYAGVLHFVYLTSSYPGVYTSDNFSDVTHLKLDPAFEDYVSEAFKPLGVYINFFQPKLEAGSHRSFRVMVVNDQPRPVSGTLLLSIETVSGKELTRAAQRFELKELGDASHQIALTIPNVAGKCILKATTPLDGDFAVKPTVSRRWVTVESKAN